MLIYISNILNAIKVHNPPKAPILATYGVTTSILAVAPKDCIIEKQLPATTWGGWQQAAKEPALTPATVNPKASKHKNKTRGINDPISNPTNIYTNAYNTTSLANNNQDLILSVSNSSLGISIYISGSFYFMLSKFKSMLMFGLGISMLGI